MEAVVPHRVGVLAYFCPVKQGQDFKPLAAPLYSDMGQVPPPHLTGEMRKIRRKKEEMFCAATACHRKGPGRGTADSNSTVENKRGLNSSAILKVQFST